MGGFAFGLFLGIIFGYFVCWRIMRKKVAALKNPETALSSSQPDGFRGGIYAVPGNEQVLIKITSRQSGIIIDLEDALTFQQNLGRAIQQAAFNSVDGEFSNVDNQSNRQTLPEGEEDRFGHRSPMVRRHSLSRAVLEQIGRGEYVGD